MERDYYSAMIGLVIFLMIAIMFIAIYFFYNQNDSSQDSPSGDNNDEDSENHWGVDSANLVDKELYQCVKENFGAPKVWGRYLGNIEDVSQGLTTDEVDYLHQKDIKILVIYNHIEDATGYDHGVKHANQAIDYADDLHIPEGTALFGDIEPKFPVTNAFIEGWYDTLTDSVYEPGLYGVFDEDSKLLEAYNGTKESSQKNTVIWTAYPQKEITSKQNAPKYNPKGPSNALVYGWQYAIESTNCNIDTNLFHNNMLDYLW